MNSRPSVEGTQPILPAPPPPLSHMRWGLITPEVIQCAQSLHCVFLYPSPRTFCPYLATPPFLPVEILLMPQEPSQMYSLPKAFPGDRKSVV